MFRKKRIFWMTFIIMLMVILIPSTCYGNAGEPPSILIIVTNPPDDLKISMGSKDKYVEATITDKITEKYFAFYSHDLRIVNDYNIKVETKVILL
ncbi:MAG: hypothetical protein ACOYJ1_10505 [Peptococcales bacterium]|jgi:hypothetical protein